MSMSKKMDLNIVPCIRAHKHLFNAHKICQWCNVPKDEIELKASRLRIKQLEEAIAKHKKFVKEMIYIIFST